MKHLLSVAARHLLASAPAIADAGAAARVCVREGGYGERWLSKYSAAARASNLRRGAAAGTSEIDDAIL